MISQDLQDYSCAPVAQLHCCVKERFDGISKPQQKSCSSYVEELVSLPALPSPTRSLNH
jgi:hypothetical protein